MWEGKSIPGCFIQFRNRKWLKYFARWSWLFFDALTSTSCCLGLVGYHVAGGSTNGWSGIDIRLLPRYFVIASKRDMISALSIQSATSQWYSAIGTDGTPWSLKRFFWATGLKQWQLSDNYVLSCRLFIILVLVSRQQESSPKREGNPDYNNRLTLFKSWKLKCCQKGIREQCVLHEPEMVWVQPMAIDEQ